MVVGVNLRAGCARQRSENFVHVHVGGGARAGLVGIHREVVVVLPGNHFVGSGNNRIGDSAIENFEFFIDQCRRSFDLSERADLRGFQPASRNGEVFHRPLGLRPVEGILGNLHLAHGVVFDTEFTLVGHHSSLKARWGGTPRSLLCSRCL